MTKEEACGMIGKLYKSSPFNYFKPIWIEDTTQPHNLLIAAYTQYGVYEGTSSYRIIDMIYSDYMETSFETEPTIEDLITKWVGQHIQGKNFTGKLIAIEELAIKYYRLKFENFSSEYKKNALYATGGMGFTELANRFSNWKVIEAPAPEPEKQCHCGSDITYGKDIAAFSKLHSPHCPKHSL